MKTRHLSLGIVLGALALAASAGDPPPFVGTWKLDLAASTYTPGPPPRSSVYVMKAVENGHAVVADEVGADGKASHREWTVLFDGKDHPVTVAGQGPGTTIAVTRVDAHTYDWTYKVQGKVTSSGKAVYSKDGRLRTITSEGTTASGQRSTSTAVYRRQ